VIEGPIAWKVSEDHLEHPQSMVIQEKAYVPGNFSTGTTASNNLRRDDTSDVMANTPCSGMSKGMDEGPIA
jgi:hypothetical protein